MVARSTTSKKATLKEWPRQQAGHTFNVHWYGLFPRIRACNMRSGGGSLSAMPTFEGIRMSASPTDVIQMAAAPSSATRDPAGA